MGSTSDIQKRFGEHLSGYSPFTSKFSTFDLAYQEELPNRFTAERREQQLKRWSVAKKKALIAGDKDLLVRLSKSHVSGEPSGKW